MRFRNNRLAAFFALAGLVLLVPAYFLPALLMTNSVDGSRWFSIWSGIVRFFEEGNYFLASVIFLFSIIFPILKLLLTFVCCLETRFLSKEAAVKAVKITGWTAKYSMLDVLVIAMLIVLVKVDEYIQLIPTIGLYLFCAAIFASMLANMCFVAPGEQKFRQAHEGRLPRWIAWAGLLLGSLLLVGGYGALRSDGGGEVDRIDTKGLNERVVPRTVERMKVLKETYDNRETLLNKALWKQLGDLLQAFSSDTGFIAPEYTVTVKKKDGRVIETEVVAVDLEADPDGLDRIWRLPKEVALKDIAEIRLLSRVNYVKSIGTTMEEELLSSSDDPFRSMMRTWNGRVFKFHLMGPVRPLFYAGWIMLIPGALIFIGCLVTVSLRESRTAA